MKEKVGEYRRALHRIPELGFEVDKTRAYILDILQQYDCEITEIHGGVCAFFRSKENYGTGKGRDNTVALRSDMDGLPVAEETDLPYRSAHEGAMHACGHDGHMAMLLAVAGELSRMIHTLPHNVLLIFQPAEETTGGAGDICASGVLQKYNVKRIYGFHLWPMLGKHVIGSRAGEFMAKSSELDIRIEGKARTAPAQIRGSTRLPSDANWSARFIKWKSRSCRLPNTGCSSLGEWKAARFGTPFPPRRFWKAPCAAFMKRPAISCFGGSPRSPQTLKRSTAAG